MIRIIPCLIANVIGSSEYPRGVLGSLPAFPTGPTVFPGYIESAHMTPLVPISGKVQIHMMAPSRDSYDNFTLESQNPEMAHWLVNQKIIDSTRILSAPQLRLSGEFVPVSGKYAIMNLTIPPIANRDESVLFYAESNPFDSSTPAIVKYQTDCIERGRTGSEIHQLLKEYFMLQYISNKTSLPIVPKPFFVSPPGFMGLVRTLKNDFTLRPDIRSRCARSHVRYLVMERGGISMEDLISFVPDYTLPFFDAMDVLKQLLIALREIHNMGIIHGDIHRGNVVRSLENGEKVLLIDFGLARFVDPARPLPEFPIRDGESLSVRMHFTHWRYHGFVTSFRDDVLSAIALVAFSTGGLRYLTAIDQAESRRDRHFFYYLFGRHDLFTVPGTGESIVDVQLGYLEESSRTIVKANLAEIQSIVRLIDSVNEIPPHDTLIELVEDIIAHL